MRYRRHRLIFLESLEGCRVLYGDTGLPASPNSYSLTEDTTLAISAPGIVPNDSGTSVERYLIQSAGRSLALRYSSTTRSAQSGAEITGNFNNLEDFSRFRGGSKAPFSG